MKNSRLAATIKIFKRTHKLNTRFRVLGLTVDIFDRSQSECHLKTTRSVLIGDARIWRTGRGVGEYIR